MAVFQRHDACRSIAVIWRLGAPLKYSQGAVPGRNRLKYSKSATMLGRIAELACLPLDRGNSEARYCIEVQPRRDAWVQRLDALWLQLSCAYVHGRVSVPGVDNLILFIYIIQPYSTFLPTELPSLPLPSISLFWFFPCFFHHLFIVARTSSKRANHARNLLLQLSLF